MHDLNMNSLVALLNEKKHRNMHADVDNDAINGGGWRQF